MAETPPATLGAAQLIAFKAMAWLDLTEHARRGDQIDSKTIKKHMAVVV